VAAIEFYALPENWHGVYMCGNGPMADDWAEDYDDDQYPDGKPGRLAREAFRALIASGIGAEGQDTEEWPDTEHESPTAESGDAQ
jgi:hypothetical protein